MAWGTDAATHGVTIAPLAAEHDRSAFTCGVSALDRYLRTQAGQDLAKRATVAFVLTTPPGRPVLGFYTLAATSVQLHEFPPAVANRFPKYPSVPSTHLGRLAVDERVRGRGYGQLLLLDACRRSLQAACVVASAAIVVDAKDDHAVRFYAAFGFLPLVDQPSRLYLPMRSVEALGGASP